MFDKTELLKMYARLPQTEQDAIDQVIMDEGISHFQALIDAMDMVQNYFKESSDV